MAFQRLHGLALCMLLATSTLLTGCMPDRDPEKSGILQIREAGIDTKTLPLRKEDYRAFESALFGKLTAATANDRNQFRILETANLKNGTYVLYSTPGNDGLAFAGRNVNGGVTIFESNMPFVRRDDQDLISLRAVPPNNNVYNAGYGVLAGRVYSPFIENVEVSFRDGMKQKVNVSHSRSFLIIRKGFDTRYAKVQGFDMNGNPYWELDTR